MYEFALVPLNSQFGSREDAHRSNGSARVSMVRVPRMDGRASSSSSCSTPCPNHARSGFALHAVEDGAVSFRYEATDDDLRPSRTVSGPTLMELSDAGMYLAILASLGPTSDAAAQCSSGVETRRSSCRMRPSLRAVILRLSGWFWARRSAQAGAAAGALGRLPAA
jgi:acyl-coenzyme A thioesterase PaaI-like protein